MHHVGVNSSDDLFGYAWLTSTTDAPGAAMQVASCFGFFDGVSVDEVVARGAVRDARSTDLSETSEPIRALPDYCGIAIFDGGSGWVVSYQDNGYPHQFARTIARSHATTRAVVAYWNVNAHTEFSYWERGDQIVSFDWPQDRIGSDPDRLTADMAETVGLVRTGDEGLPVAHIYAQMLGLADRITGTHLDSTFLQRRSVVVGEVDD